MSLPRHGTRAWSPALSWWRDVGFVGMDVVAILLLARSLDEQSQHVTSSVSELGTAISTTEWSGNDQAVFAERWQSAHAPALRRVSELLREAAQAARSGVDGQRRASGAR